MRTHPVYRIVIGKDVHVSVRPQFTLKEMAKGSWLPQGR